MEEIRANADEVAIVELHGLARRLSIVEKAPPAASSVVEAPSPMTDDQCPRRHKWAPDRRFRRGCGSARIEQLPSCSVMAGRGPQRWPLVG